MGYWEEIHSRHPGICPQDCAQSSLIISKSRFFKDKVPGNYLHIGFIKTMLANARIIHLSRHPVANCLSIYEQDYESLVSETEATVARLGGELKLDPSLDQIQAAQQQGHIIAAGAHLPPIQNTKVAHHSRYH